MEEEGSAVWVRLQTACQTENPSRLNHPGVSTLLTALLTAHVCIHECLSLLWWGEFKWKKVSSQLEILTDTCAIKLPKQATDTAKKGLMESLDTAKKGLMESLQGIGWWALHKSRDTHLPSF